MKIHFLSFASSDFYKSLDRIKREAELSGFFDTVICLKPSDLPLKYRVTNILLLNSFTRGYGYWIWKSYIVKLLLAKIDFGDILLYADAGCVINKEGKKKFNEYIQLLNVAKYSNVSFRSSFLEKNYSKGDLFKYFGVENNEIIKNSNQLIATVFFLKKDDQSISLIEEWYSICHDQKKTINDAASKYPNYASFIDHRHDQSVFSVLRKLRGSIIIPDETFFYDWDEKKEFPIHARRLRQ